MKRFYIIAGSTVLLLAIVACEFSLSPKSEESAGLALQAAIDAPADGVSLPKEATVINYHATAPDGIAAVELSINGEVVSNVATPDSTQTLVALQYTWKATLTGSHTIRVRAQGLSGQWSDYAAVTVNVIGGDDEGETERQGEQETQPTDTPEPTATPEGLEIINVENNVDKFYYKNTTCGPKKITISAEVTQPDKVYGLYLFTRFEDKEGEGMTKWDLGHVISKKSEGKYSITLVAENILNYHTYEFALMHFQLVATDSNQNRIAATEVFKTRVTLEVCP
ncbi:MAG TPA: hypothetical protein G4N92_05175 [Anaerolineae bacterium]|nr:hypothetical protein [Anaerolineae bacterium]